MEFLRQSDEILSVGEFSRRFKMLIKTHIPELWLKGEISNLKTYSSGHTYFTLKDDEGSISAVLFKGYSRNMTLRLADGMRIFAFGEISIYEARGNYQIVVKAVIPDGAGDLAARFQALKEKLAAEGVFDADRKKQIPLLPRRVAVATSPQGAAIRDFCRILSRRGWKGEIVVIPARVQGAEAAGELCEAVRIAENFTFPDRGGFDLLILMRGGGSLEDLWPFNEEKEENRQSQDGERLLYYLALGEFLMFLGTLLSGTGQIEKFSRKYLERMVYVIRYMQDMDGRKKHHFCYE